MCSIWSARICFVSKSSRPISVDLPSSTEPAVTSRRRSVAARLEVTDTFPVLHRGLREAVVRAGLAALGDLRRSDLLDHLVHGRRTGLDAAGAGHVADGAEAHGGRERLLLRQPLDVRTDRVEH